MTAASSAPCQCSVATLRGTGGAHSGQKNSWRPFGSGAEWRELRESRDLSRTELARRTAVDEVTGEQTVPDLQLELDVSPRALYDTNPFAGP